VVHLNAKMLYQLLLNCVDPQGVSIAYIAVTTIKSYVRIVCA